MTTKTYGSLRFHARENCWLFEDVLPHVSLRLKGVFPRIHEGRTGRFNLANQSEIAADIDWFLRRYPMEMSRSDRIRLTKGRKAYEKRIDCMEKILTPEYDSATFEFDMLLRQMTGIAKSRQAAAVTRMMVEQGRRPLLCGYHHEVYW